MRIPSSESRALLVVTLSSALFGCLGDASSSGAVERTDESAVETAAEPIVSSAGARVSVDGLLTAAWWRWVFSVPQSKNPLLDETGANCGEGQVGPVWFLGGTFGGPASRACTVPEGKALLIPILNVADGAAAFDCEPTVPGVACDVDALRGLAAAQVGDPQLLSATIDGVPVEGLLGRRVKSPVFPVAVPSVDGLFGLAPGTYRPNVSDGYWLFIKPPAAGSHVVHIHGIANLNAPFGVTDVDVTYALTIARHRN